MGYRRRVQETTHSVNPQERTYWYEFYNKVMTVRQCLCLLVLTGTLATNVFAAGKGPEIQVVDNKLSVNAESVSLGRLLRLFDLGTGMRSTVPPALANRNISVRFSGLSLMDGIRKIFQGLPLDYVVIEGQRIIVTAESQTISPSDVVPVYPSPDPGEQTFGPDVASPSPIPGQQQQPALIQTPFGPIANPGAAQQVVPNAPVSGPGQHTP
jgi:hypothetical protein